MTADFVLLLLSIVAGATLQVGVGVGFSIVVAPIMMVIYGTATAVPVLLMLNTLVSAAAIDAKIRTKERGLIGQAILGCLIGIALGLLVYPYLSEQIVLSLTAVLLLIGVLTTLVPMKSNISPFGYKAVSGLSGLATVWAATPGPLMMFGLLAVGRPAKEARKLVQPVALVAYGVAFALHGLADWQVFITAPGLPQFAFAAIIGSALGRLIGPKLPQNILTAAIRVISVIACIALFHRAYFTG